MPRAREGEIRLRPTCRAVGFAKAEAHVAPHTEVRRILKTRARRSLRKVASARRDIETQIVFIAPGFEPLCTALDLLFDRRFTNKS